MERNALEFFMIDGCYYGGDQNWSDHKWMKLGGCSAVTFCETCIWLAKTRPALRALYPYDPECVTKEDFLAFFKTVFRYVYPGLGGLSNIDRFCRMAGEYVATTGMEVEFGKLYGARPYEEAERFVKEAIDAGLPVMYLMLKHKDKAFDDYEWHWFTLTGYQKSAEGFTVEFATWAKKHSFDLKRAWNTGASLRGGMVVLKNVECRI